MLRYFFLLLQRKNKMTDAIVTDKDRAPTTIPTIAPVDNPFPLNQNNKLKNNFVKNIKIIKIKE